MDAEYMKIVIYVSSSTWFGLLFIDSLTKDGKTVFLSVHFGHIRKSSP
jgi:hypothetical protein